jgi:carbamoylphosphate synthase large subunit
MNTIKGSWINSARNVSYNKNILKAELAKPGGEWVYQELEINDSNRHLSYDNINGSFAVRGVTTEQQAKPIINPSLNQSKILFSETQFSNHNKQLINIHPNTEVIKFKTAKQVIADAKGKDLIIPMSFKAVKLICDNRAQFNKEFAGKICCVKDYKTIEICKDKLKFTKFMYKHGFEQYIPQIYQTMVNKELKTFSLKSSKDLEKSYIFKYTSGYGGEGYFVEHSIPNMLSKIKKLKPKKDYYIQEYIQGDEYCAHLFVVDGKIISWIYYHQLDKADPFHILKGALVKYEVITDHEFIKHGNSIFSSILAALNFTGFCNFDYRIRDNKIYIFEINPRYGSSMIRHHVNFGKMLNVAREVYSKK